MNAVYYSEYGPPEVLSYREVETPVAAAGEVLVAVKASSLNYGDLATIRGKPIVARLWSGFLKPKYHIPGGDLAGVVAAVGPDVTRFQPGDEVYGDIGDNGFGAFAEYVAVREELLAPKPENITFAEAAAAGQAAVVALQGLRDAGQIQPDRKVIINGASGGIGLYAVQIAKTLGAEVTAVCSAANLPRARDLGADFLIDYKQEDFTAGVQRYDLIFDIVANRSVSDYARVLNPGGTYVACAFNATSLFLGPLLSRGGEKRVVSLVHKQNTKDLLFLKELFEAGELVSVIDRSFPLYEVAAAVRYYENGHDHGKVVITV
jgi:NADPH:quinone reductase-like Zn-dependent oxidoreductase